MKKLILMLKNFMPHLHPARQWRSLSRRIHIRKTVKSIDVLKDSPSFIVLM